MDAKKSEKKIVRLVTHSDRRGAVTSAAQHHGRRLFLRSCLATAGLSLLDSCGGGGGSSGPPVGAPPFTQLLARSASMPQVGVMASTQRCPEWCWAACAETLVRSYGAVVMAQDGQLVGQEYFSLKLFGAVLCQGATPYQMAAALTDTYRSNSGRPISLIGKSVLAYPLPLEVNLLAVNLIRAGYPFSIEIVRHGETNAHYLVVYGIDWWEDANGNVIEIRGLRVADPLPLEVYSAFGIQPPPQYLDSSVYLTYTFVGMVWIG